MTTIEPGDKVRITTPHGAVEGIVLWAIHYPGMGWHMEYDVTSPRPAHLIGPGNWKQWVDGGSCCKI